MSVDIARLLNNARTYAPGALDAVLYLELFNVMDDFFRGSNAWRAEIDIPVVAGTTEYALTAPTDSQLARLLWIVNADNQSVAASMPTLGTVKLVTIPSHTETVTATVSLSVDAPTAPATAPTFPEQFLNAYFDGILSGLLSRIMSQPAKPYTNTALATFHMRKFRSVRAQAKSEALRQNLNNAQAWRFPQSFSTRRK